MRALEIQRVLVEVDRVLGHATVPRPIHGGRSVFEPGPPRLSTEGREAPRPSRAIWPRHASPATVRKVPRRHGPTFLGRQSWKRIRRGNQPTGRWCLHEAVDDPSRLDCSGILTDAVGPSAAGLLGTCQRLVQSRGDHHTKGASPTAGPATARVRDQRTCGYQRTGQDRSPEPRLKDPAGSGGVAGRPSSYVRQRGERRCRPAPTPRACLPDQWRPAPGRFAPAPHRRRRRRCDREGFCVVDLDGLGLIADAVMSQV